MITEKIMVESIRHVLSLNSRGKEKLGDEIYAKQPNLFRSVFLLKNFNIPVDKIEDVLVLFFILYDVFQKRSGFSLPEISEEMIMKIIDKYASMMKYIDKEGKDGIEIIATSLAKGHYKFVAAFVFCYFKEHGFIKNSKANERCILMALVLMDCFIQASKKVHKN